MQCRFYNGLNGYLTTMLTALILVFAVTVVCCSCIFKDYVLFNLFSPTSYLCCMFFTIVLVILVIVSSIFVFISYQMTEEDEDAQDPTTMCQFVEVPTVAVVASYLFIALVCLSMTASCCYIGKQKRNHSIPVCHCRAHTDV